MKKKNKKKKICPRCWGKGWLNWNEISEKEKSGKDVCWMYGWDNSAIICPKCGGEGKK